MKKIPLFLHAFCLFAGLPFYHTPYQDNLKTTSPVLTFTKKIHDFGVVPQDTLLMAKFPFTNTGNAPLIIQEVQPECLCTGYTLSKDTIPSKESAYIELQLNTLGKRGKYKIYAG